MDIECKYRKTLPAWLFDKAWSQANEGTGTPMIVVGKHNSENMFAIVDLDDFIKILAHAVEFQYERGRF